MSDQERISYEPMTTVEIDCATSAKGDVNVSWRVKVQVPSGGLLDETQLRALQDTLDYLSAATGHRAAMAKSRYLKQLENVANGESFAVLPDPTTD